MTALLAGRDSPGRLDSRAVLRAAGVVDRPAGEAAVLQDVSRSHDVWRVDLADGRSYVVKQVSASGRALGRSLHAELYAYRLATWRPGLAAALPTPVHLDERRQVVALVAAAPAQLFAHHVDDAGFPGVEPARALGRTLGAVHADTAGQPLLTVAACGVLSLPDTAEVDWHLGDESPGARSVARTASADPVLAPALREGAAALRPTCLVHGDVKWDNTVLDPGPPARVLLFDWELSGSGDPAWDVGSALADTCALPVRMRGAGALPRDAAAWLPPQAAALLRGYAAAATPAAGGVEGGRAEVPLSRRVVLCWIGRTVHLALECAGAAGEGHPVVGDLLEVARRLAGVRDELTGLVARELAG